MSTLTRFNVPQSRRLGDLPSGYDGRLGQPTGITVPPCGLEDVDGAVFSAFDRGIGFEVSRDGEEPSKPPVVFASGERWAIVKRKRGVRDANGSLILPLITVIRTGLVQDATADVTGRGINQQTGELVVSRRLDRSDRGHQLIRNALGLANQQNVAVAPERAAPGQITTRDTVGASSLDPDIVRGALLVPDRRRNVYETITIPSPQFFTATYEVTMWAQYVVHVNQMWERLVDSFLPQGNALRLDVDNKGYWFIATVDGNAYTPDNNFDDMTSDERVVKHKFTLRVPAYRIAGGVPGAPVPIRRTVSSPIVSFAVEPSAGEDSVHDNIIDDPYLGADDPTLPLDPSSRPRRNDARRTGMGPLGVPSRIDPADPALLKVRRGTTLPTYAVMRIKDPVTGDVKEQNVRIKSSNPSAGEAVFSASPDGGFDGLVFQVASS